MGDGNQQWYSNKELFEQILSMKEDFNQLRLEMRQTREIIKKYNGLREKIIDNQRYVDKEIQAIKTEVKEMQARNKGKSNVLTAIREWGGWIVAILMLILNFVQG